MKILMRGGKSPFQSCSYEETLARNVLGTNSGNLIFAEATWKTLSVKSAQIKMNGYSANPKNADFINENYDMMVLPFANAFRPSFQKHLDNFSALIEKLKIPVAVIGIGAQDSINRKGKRMTSIEDSVQRFCSAVLDKSSSIGVRGEYTYDFLRRLGFSDNQVDIIGCPSMFYFGDKFPEIKKSDSLHFDDPISMNVSPYVKDIEKLFNHNYQAYKNLVYVPQNNESLDQILWNGEFMSEHGKVFPKDVNHDMFPSDRIRFFIDPTTWRKHLQKYKFIFGTRIHGNIMGLLAGTPSYVLAHDSRTLELSEYFDIPHTLMKKINSETHAKEFFEKADYSKLINGHKKRFDTWVDFLNKNNLEHIYSEGEDKGLNFTNQIDAVDFPIEISTYSHQKIQNKDMRINWANSEIKRLRLKAKAKKVKIKTIYKSTFLDKVFLKIKRRLISKRA